MNLQTYLIDFFNFLQDILMPLLVTVVTLVFVWNATRFFIFQSDTEEGREKAKTFTLWSIVGFVVTLSVWGIVHFFANILGLNTINPIVPDYMCKKLHISCTTDQIQQNKIKQQVTDTLQIPLETKTDSTSDENPSESSTFFNFGNNN